MPKCILGACKKRMTWWNDVADKYGKFYKIRRRWLMSEINN